MTRTIRETVKEYDAEGKLVREVVTETTENDTWNLSPSWTSTTTTCSTGW